MGHIHGISTGKKIGDLSSHLTPHSRHNPEDGPIDSYDVLLVV